MNHLYPLWEHKIFQQINYSHKLTSGWRDYNVTDYAEVSYGK